MTGLAFQNGFRTMLGVPLSIWTIVIAHATFCIVTVFNNVQARFQRLGGNFEQASMDLGAGPFTTFRLVTLPMLRSALLAGGLLAFGLSFDEIVVTHVHRQRQRQDAADLDLRQPLPAQPGAGRQRAWRLPGDLLGGPDLLRAAALRLDR